MGEIIDGEAVTVTDTEEIGDFARVAGMVDDAPGTPGAEPQPAAPVMDAIESLGGLLAMAAGMAGIVGYKNIAGLWTPATCAQCAGVVVPVLRKYPWGGRVLDFLETGAGIEEMALGAFLVPMGFATMQAWQADTKKADDAPGDAAAPVGSVDVMREVNADANG